MDNVQMILFLVGTFLPVWGLFLVFFIADYMEGSLKTILHWLGPMVILGLCFSFGEKLAYNGNLLYAALFGLMIVFLSVYYPVIAVMALVKYFKKKK